MSSSDDALLGVLNSRSSDSTRAVKLGGVTVVFPPASDDTVSDGLVALTRVLTAAQIDPDYVGGMLGGDDGYGRHFENDVFGMRPFCWCGEPDCAWCKSCACGPDAVEYTLNGEPITVTEFYDAGGYSGPGIARDIPENQCERCRDGGFYAPNFWHKPTRSWVQWYKWIGRDNVEEINGDWPTILRECLTSVPVSLADGTYTTHPTPPDYGPLI